MLCCEVSSVTRFGEILQLKIESLKFFWEILKFWSKYWTYLGKFSTVLHWLKMKLFTVTWRLILLKNNQPLGYPRMPEQGLSVILEDNWQIEGI